MDKPRRWRRIGPRDSRGGAEIGLIALACLLVAGAVAGAGIAQSILDMPDQLTWLAGRDGRVTRVNPETDQPVDRLRVAAPGDELRVTQGDGILVVTNLRTNEVTTIDLSLLVPGGTRQGNPGVEVLLAGGRIYLVDKVAAVIERLDPLTAATVGRPWRPGARLADAAIDGTGIVWALGDDGQLVGLSWADQHGELVEQSRRVVGGAGTQSVIVSHERGVTVLDPLSGTIAQVGTGGDRGARMASLPAPLVGADTSPAALVPVAAPGVAAVLLVRGGAVLTVDTAARGCQPGKPAVYHGTVFVPCLGARKVIRLDPAGQPAGPDIPTAAGGGPELVLNAGLLFVNVPGADTGLVVERNGTTRTVRTNDPRAPVHDPTQPTAMPTGAGIRPPGGGAPATTGRPRPASSGGPGATGGGTPTPRGTGGSSAPPRGTPTTPGPTTPGPGTPADHTPTGVRAEARADGTILVSWTPPRILPSSYQVLRADTRQPVATAMAAATFSIVTGLPLGQPIAFVVEAVTASAAYQSAPSNPVAAYGRPGGPNVSVQLAARSPSSLTLDVTVDVVTDGGSPVTSYDVSVSTSGGRSLGGAQGVPYGQRPYQVTANCSGYTEICLAGGDVVVTATLNNAAGAGPPASTTGNVPAPPVFNVNENVAVMMVSAGGKCLDRDLRLHTCNGGTGQLWTPRNTGDIVSATDRACLEHRQRTRLGFTSAGNDECRNREDSVRWVHVPGTPVNSLRRFRGEGLSRCITVLGDVAGEGVPVDLRDTTSTCSGTIQDLWFLYKQQPGVPMAAAATTSGTAAGNPTGADSSRASRPGDGALGGTGVALVLVPLVVGLTRWRRRSGVVG